MYSAHNTALRTVGKAARSQGLSTTLELSSLSSPHDLLSDKRPDLTTTSWPTGSALKVTDLAVTSPASDAHQYSSTPSSLDPQRLLKKRESQKVSKYRAVAQSKGGELEPLVTGTSGSVTHQQNTYFKRHALVKTLLTTSFIAVPMTTG